jgi:HEPN domain-containing protein
MLMRASDIELIHADIMSAKLILYGQNGNAPFMYNMAAYHSAQAIEKGLKYIIRDNDYILYKELADSHNISNLLLKVALIRLDFIDEHRFIAECADELSKFNNIRYGKNRISRDSTFSVYHAAKRFFKEMQQEYRQDYPDIKKNQQRANYEISQKKEIILKSDISR